MDSNRKGAIAEAEVTAAAIHLGIPVYKPVAEHGRADLVLEFGTRLMRVQCKWAARYGDVITVSFGTSRRGRNGFIRTRYTADEIDAVAAYCAGTEACYLLPLAKVGERSSIQLRLSPTRNGQRAGLHYASEYLLGAVAQLEERCHGMAEATGSSPVSSTLFESAPGLHNVGANKFRNHFGYYMELVAAGEEIHVSRRGKPYVRLLAAQQPLEIEPESPRDARAVNP
jgi:prevent-host-death family protein